MRIGRGSIRVWQEEARNSRSLVCDGEMATAASVRARQLSPVSSATACESLVLNQCPRDRQ